MNKLKLELGKTYVKRNGEFTGEMVKNHGSVYTFKDPITKISYTKRGCMNLNLPNESPNDIVREVVDMRERNNDARLNVLEEEMIRLQQIVEERLSPPSSYYVNVRW